MDLPEPFGPMIACTSFVSTARSTPLTISVPSSSATCRFLSLEQRQSLCSPSRSMPAGRTLVARDTSGSRSPSAGRTGAAPPTLSSIACLSDRPLGDRSSFSCSCCCSSAPSGCRRSAARSARECGSSRTPCRGRSDDDRDEALRSSARATEDERAASTRARLGLSPDPDSAMSWPRRLRHGEEATLVEHLGELRCADHPVAGRASPSRSASPSSSSDQILEWLQRPLPRTPRQDRHARRHRAVLHFGQVSLYAALALVASGLALAALELPRAGDRGAAAAGDPDLRRARVAAVRRRRSCSRTSIVLPPALDFLTDYDSTSSTTSRSGRRYYFSFVTAVLLALGLIFELPIFILALVRLGVLTSDQLRRNRRHRATCSSSRWPSSCRPSTRSRSPSRRSRSCCSSSSRSGSSVFLERRWRARGVALAARAVTRIRLSADWVLPVDGAPIQDGAVAVRGRPDRGRRPASRARRRRALRERGDRPRASSTRTRTSSTPSTPGSATGCRSRPGSPLHIERKAGSGCEEMDGDRAARRRRVPRAPGSRRSATRASAARRRRRAPSSACVGSSTSRSSAPARSRSRRASRPTATASPTACRTGSASASRRIRCSARRSSCGRPRPSWACR